VEDTDQGRISTLHTEATAGEDSEEEA